jgi:hypothetical protein
MTDMKLFPVSVKAARRGQLIRRRGSEALEAALLLPLILSVVFGIIQFGWYFHMQHTIQGAAREGARVAARATLTAQDVHRADAEARLRQYMLAAGVDPAKFTIKFVPDNTDSPTAVAEGEPIKVIVESQWGRCGVKILPLGKLLGGLDPLPSDRWIRGEAVMNKEAYGPDMLN